MKISVEDLKNLCMEVKLSRMAGKVKIKNFKETANIINENIITKNLEICDDKIAKCDAIIDALNKGEEIIIEK